jgi:hypothetical protein
MDTIIIEKIKKEIQNFAPTATTEQVGRVVRVGDGVAEIEGLNDVMSRGHWSVRFDPCNAVALCYGCHRITEQRREVEFLPLVKRLFGDLEWDRVFADAMKPARSIKRQVPVIAKHYRGQHEAMRKLRAAGSSGRLEFVGWMA